MALTLSGLKKTGELHLAIRFTCKSWAKMLAMYGKPLLANMQHTNTIPAQQQDHLRFQAVQMVAKRLERAEPPLRREVVEYILDPDSHMFSLRRSKANFYRVTSLFFGAVALAKWFDGISKWNNPLTTILVHVLFLILVRYGNAQLILPMMFLCMVIIGAWNYSRRRTLTRCCHTPSSRTQTNWTKSSTRCHQRTWTQSCFVYVYGPIV